MYSHGQAYNIKTEPNLDCQREQHRPMSKWIFRKGGRSRTVNWLALDSWIDSNLFDTWQEFKERWNTASSYFARFRLSGYKRAITEVLSEGLTLGTGGLAVMLTLAMPAFQEIDKGNWRATGQYSVTILDRHGEEIGKRGILHSDAVPLSDIPDHMIKSALATEDRRFYDHFGIDVLGTFRALIANLKASGVVQGGSSITQQLAKNLFLTSERSLDRKIKEAFLAIWLETHLSKDEILKLYLDRAYMGGGTFGVEAASQYYFAKSVRDITLAEAAILGGLFKAPTKYAPHVNLAASRARTKEVLSNLVEAGFMTEGQVHSARINPANITIRQNPDSPDYFLDWIFEEVTRLAQGKGQFVLTAQTTVDLRLQKAAESAVTTTLRENAGRAGQASMVAMDTDGAVRAMVGGKDYGESQFNRAAHAFRQPGSSFKPYVYLTALENGYRPNSIVVDGFVKCGRWSPRNYSGGYRGRMQMTTALAKSLNTVAVKLSLSVGREKVLANVHKLGLKWVKKTCSMALGDTGIPNLYHTAGYASFANGGKSAYPYSVTKMTNSRGDVIYSRARDEPPAERLFSSQAVQNLNYMLGQVVTAGTARRAQLEFTNSAGKTGTSSGYKDAWFMGFTGKYVAGVWFGNDNFRPTGRVTGGSLPAMAWKKFMTVAHVDQNIPQIPGLPLHPNQVAERERLAMLKRFNPKPVAARLPEKNIMPKKTQNLLKVLRDTFKKKSGQAPENNAGISGTNTKVSAQATGEGRSSNAN